MQNTTISQALYQVYLQETLLFI